MATKTTTTTATKPQGLGSANPRGFARMSPEERRRCAQIGALHRAATMDKGAMVKATQRGLWDKWRRQADPNGVLPEGERNRRAEALQKAHILKMTQARLDKQAAQKAETRKQTERAAAKRRQATSQTQQRRAS